MKVLKFAISTAFIFTFFYGTSPAEEPSQAVKETMEPSEGADAAMQIKDYVPSDAQESFGIDNTEWLFGEVISVDPLTRKFIVKYLDYETNAEKEIVVYAGENTVFDGVSSLEEIKEKDSVSLNYVVDAKESRCIASSMSVVKEPEEPVLPLAEKPMDDTGAVSGMEKSLSGSQLPPASEDSRK